MTYETNPKKCPAARRKRDADYWKTEGRKTLYYPRYMKKEERDALFEKIKNKMK